MEFLLPPWMADSLIEAPLLKHKTITPVDPEDPESSLHVRLELQDEVMNQLRVLVRHDRLLIPGQEYRASVPTVRTGNVIRQYIVFENAGGRDEMIIDRDSLQGVEAVKRQEKAWKRIVSLLGSGANEVFLVNETENKPVLIFKTHQRRAIEMAGARIGLAETRLIMGNNGAWRAEQIYRIDNKTEQNLEILLPEQGGEQQPVRLWTAQLLTAAEWNLREDGRAVTGRPVKPTIVPIEEAENDASGSDADADAASAEKRKQAIREHRLVLIPLLKTEVGDLDYIVRLVYGGKGRPLRSLRKIEFPTLETINIPVESSVVKLQLPEDFEFSFDGTMRVVDQNEATDLKTAYSKKTSERLVQTIRTGNAYARARALNSLNIFSSMVSKKSSSDRVGAEMQDGRTSELSMLPDSEKILELQQEATQTRPDDAIANEARILSEYRNQSNARSRNVAVQAGSNFSDDGVERAAQQSRDQRSRFNSSWLKAKQLANEKAERTEAETRRSGETAQSNRPEPSSEPMTDPLDTKLESQEAKRARVQSLARPKGRSSKTAEPQVADELFLGKVAKGQKQQNLGLKKDLAEQSDLPEESAVELYQQKHLMQNVFVPQSAGDAPSEESGIARQRKPEEDGTEGRDDVGGVEKLHRGLVAERLRREAITETLSDIDADFETLEGEQALHYQNFFGDGEFDSSNLPTHFASLDTEIPNAGKTYLLTSPQGKVEIEAVGWSLETTRRLTVALVTLLLVVLLYLAFHFVPKCSVSCRRFQNRASAWGMIVLGILGLFFCSFGLGLILIVVGLVMAATISDKKACTK